MSDPIRDDDCGFFAIPGHVTTETLAEAMRVEGFDAWLVPGWESGVTQGWLRPGPDPSGEYDILWRPCSARHRKAEPFTYWEG